MMILIGDVTEFWIMNLPSLRYRAELQNESHLAPPISVSEYKRRFL